MTGNKFLFGLVITTILLTCVPASASEEYMLGIFGNANEDDTIDIEDVEYTERIVLGFNDQTQLADVTNLDSGQFDLSFDVSVVNAIDVDSGSIGSTTVQLESWTLVDSDVVRVLFNLPGTTGVSGSGSLATIHFTVTGTAGDTSVLDVSDGLLVDTEAEEILSTWIDDEVSV